MLVVTTFVWIVIFVNFLDCRPNPIAMTDCGPVKGVYLDDIDPDIANFRSIRYAQPPVQNNRFLNLMTRL
jgi:hypothetical protein